MKCLCGRRLRVSVERLGTMVHCWDCRGPVAVQVPSHPGQAARLFRVGVRELLGLGGLLGVAVGAVLFTVALLLPVPEPVVAALVLAAMVFVYAELVRRWGQAGALGEGRRSIGVRAYAARAAVTLAVALVLTNAWEFGRTWLGLQAGLFREALVATAGLAVVFPLAMLLVWAAPHPRQSLTMIARHPVATGVALMVIPLGLVAAEALVALLISLQGLLPFYVVNFMPGSEALAPRFGIATLGYHDLLCVTDSSHLALYLRQLSRGVTFSTELPTALMDPPRLIDLPWFVQLDRTDYLLLRAMPMALIASVWFAALTVQARCLGLLARLSEWQRPRTPLVVEPQALQIEAGPEPDFDSRPVDAHDELTAEGIEGPVGAAGEVAVDLVG